MKSGTAFYNTYERPVNTDSLRDYAALEQYALNKAGGVER
jgi:hypothetical protein